MFYNTHEPQTRPGVTCPYCGSQQTELFSLFSQQLLTVQYYCNTCHTPFEYIKDDDVLETARVIDPLNRPLSNEA